MAIPDSYQTISFKSQEYPENLRTISSPPQRLYLKGQLLPQDQKAIAIIGSRKMTDYGKKIAWDFSFQLAKAGLTIVSGLARGVDSVAHKAALYAKGRTIAVLGSGIDLIYPPENRNLARGIIQNGAVISEFLPGTKPFPRNFLTRNRIISGLSLALLVVEGAKRSGTLSTATWAANQNREVFAIPGRLDSDKSDLPNYLIESGANVARKPEDILEILGF